MRISNLKIFTLTLAMCSLFNVSAHSNKEFSLIKLPGKDVHIKWGNPTPGTAASITYTIAKKEYGYPNGYNCPVVYPIQELTERTGVSEERIKDIVATSVKYWSDVANIDFKYVEDPKAADIVIGTSKGKTRNRGQAGIRVDMDSKLEGGEFVSLEKGAVCLNVDFDWDDGLGGDKEAWDIESVMVHEIGHTLGLNHYYGERSRMDSSYDHQEEFVGLEDSDIKGITYLYGKREKNIPMM